MRSSIFAVVVALVVSACGGPAMEAPAPGQDPVDPIDMGADSAPPVVVVPGPDSAPPVVTPTPDTGAPHVDAAAPDATPRPEASTPVRSDAGVSPVADAGPVDPWGPPYSEDFCTNTLHLSAAGCKSLNDVDAVVRATGWYEGQCSVGFQPAAAGCGEILEPGGYTLRVKLICHAGIWRANLGSCSCDPGAVGATCNG